MKSSSKRDDFTKKTKEILAKRAGNLCSICSCITTGSSLESVTSTTSIGVAAHITAASPGGPRYDASLSSEERSNITNGIWLCQNHATLIDRDISKWSKDELHRIKTAHEEDIRDKIGIPIKISGDDGDQELGGFVSPRDYGYLPVSTIVPSYRRLIDPILRDKGLTERSVLGVLMCETHSNKIQEANGVRWTIFVNPEWLKWAMSGMHSMFHVDNQEIPKEQIYGQIPAWPHNHLKFLKLVAETKAKFFWNRHEGGYLIFAQNDDLEYDL